MFQNSLLIIKADYMHKRKPVLLHLLHKGFMIQAQRKILFTPEDAAEFYKDRAEECDFMLQVIMLSKGASEAFMLTKENAVEELISTMVCYFTTSMEMERMVHVTKAEANVQAEITFIFPNYIHEPIPIIKPHKFCANPLLSPLIDQMYDIVQSAPADEQSSWKVKLADWLMLVNKDLPIITNQCSTKVSLHSEEKAMQVNIANMMPVIAAEPKSMHDRHMTTEPGVGVNPSSSFLSADSTTALLSTSTCVTCAAFDRTDACSDVLKEQESPDVIFSPKVIPLPKKKEVEEEEEDGCDEETCLKLCEKHFEEYVAEQETLNVIQEDVNEAINEAPETEVETRNII